MGTALLVARLLLALGFLVTGVAKLADRKPTKGREEPSLERVMNLVENRIEMRIPRSAWFPRDLCFPHS
jgi:uncharacterized membrane protein YphA (DoxX/SURF4 family)